MRTRRTAAFTMVELLIAIAIAAIVTVGIYGLYENYVKAFVSHDRAIEAQQTARVALDTVTQDLLRAGLQVPGTLPAIVAAAPTDMTVEYFNAQARNVSTGAPEPQPERVRYFLDGSNQLQRQVYRQVPGTPPTWSATPVAALSGALAENVFFEDRDEDGVQDAGEAPALLFTYFTQGAFQEDPAEPDALTSFPPSAAQLLDIRQVRVVVTVRSTQRDPVTKRFVYRTLRADVKPRNAGLMSTIQDNDPPATPTGLASVDPGDCGFLQISWNENDLNADPDLAGYILYYGTVPGVYINSITIPRGTPHAVAQPYLLSGLADATLHYLAIAAYDYSGNASPLSAELSGDSGTADTTPDVGDPDEAPGALAVSVGPGDNALTVSWNRVSDLDVIGYQVYRKIGPFAASDLNAIRANPENPGGDIRVVANRTMFSPSLATNITATGSGYSLRDTSELLGCTDYHYAVTALKGCNRPISGYPDTLFATTSTATQPTDTTPPDQPVLTTFPSYLRNYLNVTNPTGPANIDFTRTHIAYRTDGVHPTFTVNTSTTPPSVVANPGSALIECYSTGYGPGTFTGTGTNGVIHSGSPCDGAFHLLEGVTYYYTAVAVDTCTNLSDPSPGVSQVEAVQCADETEPGHPAVGNPPKVTGLEAATSPMAGDNTRSQAVLDWNSIDYSFSQIRDFAGYRVFRTVGDTTSTPFPTLSSIDDDKNLILTPTVTYTGLEEGKINRVRILAVDCETVARDDASHAFLASRYSTSELDARASETIIFYPGRLDLDGAIPTRTLGKTRNVVEFQAKTNINAAATPSGSDRVPLSRLVFDWTTPNGGSGSDRLLKSIWIDNGVDTFTITPSSPLASPATLSGSQLAGAGFRGATNVRFQLTFINANTGGASQARMSDYRIDAQIVYRPVVRYGSDTATLTTTGTGDVTAVLPIPASRGPEIPVVYAFDRGNGNWYEATLSPGPGRLYTATYPVDVALYLVDNSGKGIKEAFVYWATTDLTATAPPDLGSGFPTTISAAYTRVTACDADGSTVEPGCPTNNYPYPYPVIPAQTGRRVWFFVLAIDKSGNYSTAPVQELSSSTLTFTYDQ